MFGVLDRDRSELSHPRMLAWFLDPLGQHGARHPARAPSYCVPPALASRPNSISRASPSRLHARRAELIVEVPSGGFVIESTVDAVEGPAQCERIAADHPSDVVSLIFLSPSGRPPITPSASAPRWHTCRFRLPKPSCRRLPHPSVSVSIIDTASPAERRTTASESTSWART